MADAERMREVAAIICSFPDELPCVVLSAMGKVRNPRAALRAAALCVTDAPAGVTQAKMACPELPLLSYHSHCMEVQLVCTRMN